MPRRSAPLGPKRLIVTGPARTDIDEQLLHIATAADLETALRFADKIDAALAKLAFLGHSGVSRDNLSPGLRMTVLGNYCIYFRVTATDTRIIRFLHGARDVRDALAIGRQQADTDKARPFDTPPRRQDGPEAHAQEGFASTMSPTKHDVYESTPNIFADVGCPDAETHLLKAQLVSEIYRLTTEHKLTQANAASKMGISQPEVNLLLKGQFREYSAERLLRFLTVFD